MFRLLVTGIAHLPQWTRCPYDAYPLSLPYPLSLGLRNLSRHPAFDGYPSWSPRGGEFILFASDRDGLNGEFNLHAVGPDGRGLARLTETIPGVDQVREMLSPDGRFLVFNRDFPDGRVEIHVMVMWGAEALQGLPHPQIPLQGP